MSGEADIFMRFYIGDYLGDTMHLSTLEHGAYFLLIIHYFRTGKPLPDGDEALSRITRLSRSQWDSMAHVIRPFFRADTIDGASFLTHKRIDAELERAKAEYEKRKSAAEKSHTARTTKSSGPPSGNRKSRCNASAVIPSSYEEGACEDAPLNAGGVSPAINLEKLHAVIGQGAGVWLIGAEALEDDDGTIVIAVPMRVQADKLNSTYWDRLDRAFGEGKWRVELTEKAAA